MAAAPLWVTLMATPTRFVIQGTQHICWHLQKLRHICKPHDASRMMRSFTPHDAHRRCVVVAVVLVFTIHHHQHVHTVRTFTLRTDAVWISAPPLVQC